MTAGIKANSDGSAAIQVGGTDVITLTSGGAATFVTSPTTVQAGTAAAPSITFSGDTNTGIYSPGADTVGITAGGTLVGSVGLGTTLALQGATSQSGTGITFPATQSASSNANTLDDYEEGTFTPTFTTGTFTYPSYRTGYYTKVGNIVNVQIYMATNSATGSGNVEIAGLPFTNLLRTAVSVKADSWGTAPIANALCEGGTTNIALYKSIGASGGGTQVTVADMLNLSGGYNQTYINFTYRIS